MNTASSQPNMGVQSMQHSAQNAFIQTPFPNSMMSYLAYAPHTIPGQMFNPYAASYHMPQTTGSNSGFGAKNSAVQSYNSHSAYSTYEGTAGSGNAGAGVVSGQSQDYAMKPNFNSQQMGHSGKTMPSAASGNDLTGGNQGNTNGQSMYNKSHSQMNKVGFGLFV